MTPNKFANKQCAQTKLAYDKKNSQRNNIMCFRISNHEK